MRSITECNLLKPEREGTESGEVVGETTFGRREGFEGSQAVPARPSGRGDAYDLN
jgi:hypothetical protein